MLAAVTATARLRRGEGGLARRDGLIIHFAAGAVIVVVISAQDLVDTLPGRVGPVYTPGAQMMLASESRDVLTARDDAAPACAARETQAAPAGGMPPARLADGDRPQIGMESGGRSFNAPDTHGDPAPHGAVVSLADSWNPIEEPLTASGDGP